MDEFAMDVVHLFMLQLFAIYLQLQTVSVL